MFLLLLSVLYRSERDSWHDTIVSTLRTLQIPVKSNSNTEKTPHRPRVNTEPQQELVKRRDSPTNVERDVKTDPVGSVDGFKNVLDEMKTKVQTKPVSFPLFSSFMIVIYLFLWRPMLDIRFWRDTYLEQKFTDICNLSETSNKSPWRN